MLTFWGIVTAVTLYGGIPIVGGLWMFERWRSRRRNRSGECAACGTSWRSTKSSEPYLIHGRLVCQDCAETARRRMPWQFGILGLAAALATAGVVANEGLVMLIIMPAASTVVLTMGAVQLMKLANRNAERRIAAGEFPDIGAIRSIHDEEWLPQGPAV
jgi:hypothetical protein